MPLNDDLVHPVVFIIGDNRDDGRGPVGTGFFLVVPDADNPDQWHSYVVTAAHVVIGERQTAIRGRNSSGQVLPDMPVSGWMVHDAADVAVAPVGVLRSEIFVPYMPEMGYDKAGPERTRRYGEQVFFSGLLDGVPEMEAACIPMVRSGTVGAYYQPGVPLTGGRSTTAHLIDCKSYAGFSGAPCLIQWTTYRVGNRETEPPDAKPGLFRNEETRLFGILIAHFDDVERQQDRSVLKLHVGVGIVLPIERLWELMDNETVKDQQKRSTRRVGRRREATLDSVGATDDSLDQTADLMGNLLAVPKDEAREG